MAFQWKSTSFGTPDAAVSKGIQHLHKLRFIDSPVDPDQYPLLDNDINQIDPHILVPLKVYDCDPGILFHLNKKDFFIDPGIYVPFFELDGNDQKEFNSPRHPSFDGWPFEPNKLPDLKLIPHYWLNPHELTMPDFNEQNWDTLTPDEKFDLGIHPRYLK